MTTYMSQLRTVYPLSEIDLYSKQESIAYGTVHANVNWVILPGLYLK